MYYKENLTNKAAQSWNEAVHFASENGHTYVGSEHMIYGFLKEGSNVASALLERNGISTANVTSYISLYIGRGVPAELTDDNITSGMIEIFSKAVSESRRCGAEMTGTEYILYSILCSTASGGYKMLAKLKCCPESVRNECEEFINGKPQYLFSGIDEKNYPYLSRYTKNLTETAFSSGFDPVIGREHETERVIQILTRKNKNNPCLIGEAGVGKTAIVEGLAQQIVTGNVPPSLRNKCILSLDITSMLAGAKYRGDFEERIKNCLEEAKKDDSIVLFIDELHTIVGAGAAEGAIDAANILKPELARGTIRIIGATTYSEYHRFIESDAALERRFQSVTVDEPDYEQLIRILNGIKHEYEKFHSVNISDEILAQAVKLSKRYITDRFLPDKAIDVIDEACSRASIRSSRNENTVYRSGKDKLNDILNGNNVSHCSNEEKKYPCDVTSEDVTEVISEWTGIPAGKVSREENERMKNLENELKKKIIGQDQAVTQIAEAIRKCRIGLKEDNRPAGCFLLAGQTGTGKTELAKVIAGTVFDSEDNIIKIDMSEYMESHSAAKITGAPPGYLGYREGSLSETIRKKPYSVVLFDEIEKAHPDVLNLLLQISDDGCFHDSENRIVSLRNNLIILTTNTGASAASEQSIGFSSDNEKSESFRKTVNRALRKNFSPELLNRMDGIIIFEPLSENALSGIAVKFLDELADRMKNIGISMTYCSELPKYLSKNPQARKYGARAVKRQISNEIENILTGYIIHHSIKPGTGINLEIENNTVSVKNTSENSMKNCYYSSQKY